MQPITKVSSENSTRWVGFTQVLKVARDISDSRLATAACQAFSGENSTIASIKEILSIKILISKNAKIKAEIQLFLKGEGVIHFLQEKPFYLLPVHSTSAASSASTSASCQHHVCGTSAWTQTEFFAQKKYR
jgi:hypothetical protein